MVSYVVVAINVICFVVFNYVLSSEYYPHLSITKNSLSYPHSFITGSLNHGGWIHLAMNMLFVWYLCRQLKNFYSDKDLIKLQLFSLIPIGILTFLYILTFENNISVVGYSGVLFAILGALFPYMHKEGKISVVVQILVFHFIFIMINMHIAWYTHLFGFAFGYIYTTQFKIKNFGFKNVDKKIKKIKKERKKKKFSVVK